MTKVSWRIVPAVAALLLISGCSQASIPRAIPSSTPTITPTASIDRNAVYSQASAYLQSFLDSWKKNGLYAAGQKYFDSVSKSRIQTQGSPVLVAGTVKSMQPYSWVSANDFMVQVDFDLRFSKEFSLGDGGWRSGDNTQFITFKRPSASTPYQITLATGP